MYTERHVVTCFLVSDGRLLLLRRSDLVRAYRGRWTAINGSVDGEPTPKAIQLIQDETGIPATRLELIRQGEPLTVSEKGKKITWSVYPFLFRVTGQPDIRLTWQHSEYRWVDPRSLNHLRTVPMLRATLERAWDDSLLGPASGSGQVERNGEGPERLFGLPGDPNLRRDPISPRARQVRLTNESAEPNDDALKQGIPVRVVRAEAIPELSGSLSSLETEDKKPRGKGLLRDPVVHPLLDRLRHADVRGQSLLIQRGLEALRTAAERSGGASCEERLEDLRLVGRTITDIRPMSTALTGAVAQVLYELEFEMARESTVDHLLESLDQAVERVEEQHLSDLSLIADEISRLIPHGGTVMTTGYCVPLLEGLQRCTQFSVRALVLEHQPVKDGRMMARAVAALGKSTTLVADSAMGLHVQEADLVIVGAESVMADGSAIGDIGAYPLALVAAAAGVRFYVAAPTSAIDLRPDDEREIVLEEGDPAEVWAESVEGLSVRNVLHERVPPDYIYGFITEDGYLHPSSVQHEVEGREHLHEVLRER